MNDERFARNMVIGFSIGLIGQVVWCVLFWNDKNLFMFHWAIAFVGVAYIVGSLFYEFWSTRK